RAQTASRVIKTQWQLDINAGKNFSQADFAVSGLCGGGAPPIKHVHKIFRVKWAVYQLRRDTLRNTAFHQEILNFPRGKLAVLVNVHARKQMLYIGFIINSAHKCLLPK